MFKDFQEDRLIFFCTLALVGFGLVMVYSASSVMAMKRYGDSAYFLKRQMVWAAAGVLTMTVVGKLDYRKLRIWSLPLLIVCFLLLVLVLVPGVGAEINGSRRWVRLAGLSFQPSEFTKLALLMFIAASLAKRADKLNDFLSGAGPYLMFAGPIVFLIALEPDLGAAAAVGVVVLVMLFAAGARLVHLTAILFAAIPFVYRELFGVGFRYRRFMDYLHSWSNLREADFQTFQSFLAFGGGGLTGLGLGEGRQKLLFLPEPHSDFIFSVVGEELGLAGAMAVAALFAMLTFCGLRLAMKCEDNFGRLLAIGLTVMLGMQALVNMGVTVGLIPNKGMPLPFISAGGSSLFVVLLSVGLLLSIAKTGRESARTTHGITSSRTARHRC